MNRNNKRNKASRGRNYTAKQRECRASGREVPYLVNSIQGTGGLLVAQSGVLTPDTSGAFVIIIPDSIGPRCAQLARLYHQWRINNLTYVYRPRATAFAMVSSSNLITSTGPNAGGTQSAAVMGFSLDPALGSLNQSEVVEQGGRWMNLSKPASIKYNNSKWLYCQPTAADTAPDNRFISIGNLHVIAEASGGANGNLYGYLEAHWDISFRYPVDADNEAALTSFVGDSLRKSISLARDEAEKKTSGSSHDTCGDETPVIIPTGGFFTRPGVANSDTESVSGRGVGKSNTTMSCTYFKPSLKRLPHSENTN